MLLEWHQPFLASVWEVCATFLPAGGGEARGQVSVILSTPAFPGSSPDCLPPPRLPTKCTTSWGGLLYSHSYGVHRPSHHHTCKPNMECLVFLFSFLFHELLRTKTCQERAVSMIQWLSWPVPWKGLPGVYKKSETEP